MLKYNQTVILFIVQDIIILHRLLYTNNLRKRELASILGKSRYITLAANTAAVSAVAAAVAVAVAGKCLQKITVSRVVIKTITIIIISRVRGLVTLKWLTVDV